MSEHVHKHRIVLHQDASDDYPWTHVECDWGTDPSRPCRAVTCPKCDVTGSGECLDEGHEGAEEIPGCGVKEWFDAGDEGIRIEGLHVSVPCDPYWNGNGWTLTCKEDG